MSSKPVQYGGQAVIEGVMMRGPHQSAVAVRLPNGEIEVTYQDIKAWSAKPILKLPIIRGFVALIESLIVGFNAITYSAERAAEEPDGEPENGEPEDGESKDRSVQAKAEDPAKEKPALGWLEMTLTIVIALGLGIVLFVAIPTGAAHLLKSYVPGALLQNLLEGVIRLIVFFLYIIGISRIKDIKRVFEYHGAEHKTIFTHEAKEELTVENARKYTTLHPRCGTSFLLIVVVVSILVFAFLGTDPLWWRIVSRILLMPLVAGIAYEILKFTSRHLDRPSVRWIVAPGLLLQRLTTREPDDRQLEVAIAALKGVLESGQELS